MNRDKKTALITGGSRGIGFEIAREMGDNGYSLVIMARKGREEYPGNVGILEDLKIDYHWICGDISDTEDRKRAVREAVRIYGGIDVLVNNAGVAPRQRCDLLQMSEDDYDYVLETNTKGNMFMTQLVANQMLRQAVNGTKRGTIINISSCSSQVVSTDRGAYCISKAGISMLTKLYAKRLASEKIFVYEIRPGVIETDMTREVSEKYERMIQSGEFPIARWGKPEDVARVVIEFCGDSFCYTTGNYLDVDGGYHIMSI